MNLKEIEEYNDYVLEILFDVLVSVNNAKYIGTKSSENEDWVKGHPFFKHYFHQLRFISIIQLTKLFNDSKNEKHNFHKIIRTLESTPLPEIDELNRNKITNQADMKKLISDLKSMLHEVEEDISLLVRLRNNVYAHGKKINKLGLEDSNERNISLSWERIKSLSELAFNFYNKINGVFYGGEFIFPNKKNWSPEWLIERVATTRAKR